MSNAYDSLRKIFEPYIGKELTDAVLRDPETFVVTYGCDNCGKRSNIRFKKGTLVPDQGIKCPNCGTRRTTKAI